MDRALRELEKQARREIKSQSQSLKEGLRKRDLQELALRLDAGRPRLERELRDRRDEQRRGKIEAMNLT